MNAEDYALIEQLNLAKKKLYFIYSGENRKVRNFVPIVFRDDKKVVNIVGKKYEIYFPTKLPLCLKIHEIKCGIQDK